MYFIIPAVPYTGQVFALLSLSHVASSLAVGFESIPFALFSITYSYRLSYATMLQYSICAFLAPALVSAAAFPWAGPEPTLVVPEIDHWSPAPTEGPKLGKMELFRRDDDNTCGYISQDPSTRRI